MAEATQDLMSEGLEEMASALVADDDNDGSLDDVLAEVPDEPTNEAGAEPAEGVDRGDGRDAKGKFAPKDKEPETEPAAAEAPTPDEAQAAAPNPPQAEASAPEPARPYTVKANGQEYAIEGATYTPDGGLTIPAQAVPHVNRVIQEGIDHMTGWESRLETEREKARSEGKAISDKLMEQIGGFADLLADGFVPVRLSDGTQVLAVAPQAQPVLEFFSTYKAKLPLLMAEQKAAELEAKLNARTQQEQAQTAESFDSQVSQAIEAQIKEWRNHPQLKVLTQEDWAELAEVVSDTRSAYIVEQDGEKYLDTDKLGKLYEKRAALRTKLAAEAKAAQEAARFNQKQTQTKASPSAQRREVPRAAAKPEGAAPTRPWDTVWGEMLKHDGVLPDDDE